MEANSAKCRINSGSGWRCSYDALPGTTLCQKHALKYKQKNGNKGERRCKKGRKDECKDEVEREEHVRAVSENDYGGKRRRRIRKQYQSLGMPTNVTNGTLIDLEDDESIELVGENQVYETPNKHGEQGIDPSSSNDISEKFEEDEVIELLGENLDYETPNKDCEHGIDPPLASYISQKVEYLRKAVNASIQVKAKSLEDLVMRRCQYNYDNMREGNMKIRTRFELPFFQRYLDQQKYGYTLGLIESYINQPKKDLNSTISCIGKFSLTRNDMSTLGPAGWLSRGVIGSYGHLINGTSKRLSTNGTPAVIVSHLLYNQLATVYQDDGTCCRANFKVVRLDDFTGLDPTETKILIPVNFWDLHWGLVMVDMSRLTMTVLDPKFSNNEITTEYKNAMELIKQHLSKACASSDGERKRNKWTVENCDEVLPLQSNDYDCGLFILAYMECIVRGIPFHFDMDDSRSRIVICSDLLDYILLGD